MAAASCGRMRLYRAALRTSSRRRGVRPSGGPLSAAAAGIDAPPAGVDGGRPRQELARARPAGERDSTPSSRLPPGLTSACRSWAGAGCIRARSPGVDNTVDTALPASRLEQKKLQGGGGAQGGTHTHAAGGRHAAHGRGAGAAPGAPAAPRPRPAGRRGARRVGDRPPRGRQGRRGAPRPAPGGQVPPPLPRARARRSGGGMRGRAGVAGDPIPRGPGPPAPGPFPLAPGAALPPARPRSPSPAVPPSPCSCSPSPPPRMLASPGALRPRPRSRAPD